MVLLKKNFFFGPCYPVRITVGYTGGELWGDLSQRYPWKGVKPWEGTGWIWESMSWQWKKMCARSLLLRRVVSRFEFKVNSFSLLSLKTFFFFSAEFPVNSFPAIVALPPSPEVSCT